jgi:hypothetical protein
MSEEEGNFIELQKIKINDQIRGLAFNNEGDRIAIGTSQDIQIFDIVFNGNNQSLSMIIPNQKFNESLKKKIVFYLGKMNKTF